MPKNYGILNSEFNTMYTEDDYKTACWFNFWMGGLAGSLTLLLLEFLFMWGAGWF